MSNLSMRMLATLSLMLLAVVSAGAPRPAGGRVGDVPDGAPTAIACRGQTFFTGEIVRQGPITPPRRVKYVRPVYPRDARRRGIKGTVILGAVIDSAGVVRSTEIYRSIPLVDAAAAAAVCQWRFTAAVLRETPVAVEMTVTVDFPPRSRDTTR